MTSARVFCLPLVTLVVALPAIRNSCAQQPVASTSTGSPADVEFFETKVRPILVARCFECHGGEKHKGNLRLDSRAGVLAGGDTGPAVVPGKPADSLLVDAIRYGQTYQMPPKSQLPADEIDALVDWVARGVPWGQPSPNESAKPAAHFDLAARAKHWCFQPLADGAPPEVADSSWVRTPIDRFILAGLAAASLSPRAPCDKPTLLRRVTYDLTGLPPKPEEIREFEADESPAAYERVVERLLASPHYGERWARHWLDLVRYAETHGHEHDFEMANTYRYRDYVIRALNDDLPYDQFVVEHVAGDLVDPPRRDAREGFNESIIATGSYFLGEAKHSPVDVRQDEADRVDNQIDVFAKTFLALTVSCARCHDHKFDAISTKDYYALAGYLQSSRYQQAFIDAPGPLTSEVAQLAAIRARRERIATELARAVLASQLERLSDTMLRVPSADRSDAWVKYLDDTARKNAGDPFHAWAVLSWPTPDDNTAFVARRGELASRLSTKAGGEGPRVLFGFDGSSYGPWTTTGAAFGDAPAAAMSWDFVRPRGRSGGQLIESAAAHSGQLSLKLRGTLRSPTFEITSPTIFYRVYGTGGSVRLIVDGLQLIQNPIYGGLKFEPGGPLPHWHSQDVSKWIGHRAYIELIDDGDGFIALEQVVMGDRPPLERVSSKAINAILSDESVRAPGTLVERYESLFRRALAQLATDASPEVEREDVSSLVNWALDQRVPGGDALGPKLDELAAQLAALDQAQRDREGRLVPPRQCMAIADGTAENERVFIRGNPKTLGDEVPRRFLEVLGGASIAPPAAGSGRLELARQLVAPSDPLVPRVMVNRIWKHHFGEGIVRTCDDFGVMGQPPTHPELLDWLAREFVGRGWSLKHMHRLMVLSSAYRMSSRPQHDVDRRDPQNKLLHRMSVRRLEAECVRDAVLACSDRADLTLLGPGVMPYLTPHMTGRGRPATSGPLDGNGRRSIYLAVRRNFLPPMFLAFDYPIPFTTIGRRSTSNVPAQALAMMNNQLVIEQAQHWGRQIAADATLSPDARVRRMYLTALGRPPDDVELQQAIAFVGETSAGDAAAWTELAHVLFNLKEFVFIP